MESLLHSWLQTPKDAVTLKRKGAPVNGSNDEYEKEGSPTSVLDEPVAKKQTLSPLSPAVVAFYGDSNGVGTGLAKDVLRKELQKELGVAACLTMHVKGGATIGPKPQDCHDVMKFHFLPWLTKTGPRTRSGYNRPWQAAFGSSKAEWEAVRSGKAPRASPAVACIMLGTNDIAQWRSSCGPPGGTAYQAQLKEHLLALLAHIRDAPAGADATAVRFILVLPPCVRPGKAEQRSAVHKMLRDFARIVNEANGPVASCSSSSDLAMSSSPSPVITVVDPAFSRGVGDYDKDNVHLTVRGAKKLAQKLAPLVLGILSGER